MAAKILSVMLLVLGLSGFVTAPGFELPHFELPHFELPHIELPESEHINLDTLKMDDINLDLHPEDLGFEPSGIREKLLKEQFEEQKKLLEEEKAVLEFQDKALYDEEEFEYPSEQKREESKHQSHVHAHHPDSEPNSNAIEQEQAATYTPGTTLHNTLSPNAGLNFSTSATSDINNTSSTQLSQNKAKSGVLSANTMLRTSSSIALQNANDSIYLPADNVTSSFVNDTGEGNLSFVHYPTLSSSAFKFPKDEYVMEAVLPEENVIAISRTLTSQIIAIVLVLTLVAMTILSVYIYRLKRGAKPMDQIAILS